MITAAVLVDSRCPSHFPHHQHEHLVQHASLFEVNEQGRSGLVHGGQQGVPEGLEIVVVSVPGVVSGIVDQHIRHAGFHQAACQQGALAHRMGSVHFPNRSRFTVQVECLLSLLAE